MTHMRPVSTALATRMARLMSLVHTAPPRPYSLSLAMAITSSSVLNFRMQATGPKISSWATRMSLVTFPRRVGRRKLPLSNPFSVTWQPPQRTVAPSSLPISMYFKIFSIWPLLIWLPIWVSASQGRPTFTWLKRFTASSTNRS